ncbi:ZU5 domain-containing protein [Anaeroplasma bactoclasticum]|uniref:ZU5 domain-containing protein n=1 Tax=Anaeroplasma bactoclasticum TaxID=2088 RepID=A0A397RYI5_9MOLU|nr:hypothetical protein [Anaeroplasma bactoclasticum]RIA78342.1 ZU5 domain-containing protein [Anaeroplasma bactoclasticum]
MRSILKSIFKNKTLLFIITVLMFSFLLAGCKNGGDTNQVDNTPKEYEAVEKTIGLNGGEVKDEKSGLGLTIPSGALEKDTNISVQYVENKEHVSIDLLTSFLGAAEFKPSGTVFSEPVEVSMNLTEAPSNSTICVFCYDEVNNVWDFITDANCNGKTATFKITHFSKYQCLNITEAMYSKYIDLVNQAQRDGKSDSWITESYRDYLVNEKHVMDYYEESGGYYYEPVGLFIGGAYQLNGKQGDGDELTKRYGESNKVGNTYGYSKVGGKTVSYAEAKSELGKTKEKKDVIDVTVTIDYKMIKPTIDLTASKTTLKRGEVATVNVYCHYAKAGNTIYPDFALPNYKLQIQKPTHLSVENTEVTTNDSGKAVFTVKSKDGEKDTVKVTFDVAGDFGTHAEGSITFRKEEDNTYNLSGHIVETYEFEHSYDPSRYEEDEYTKYDIIKPGKVKITIEYDIEGTISWTKFGSLSGEVGYKNITAKLESTAAELKGKKAYSVVAGNKLWTNFHSIYEPFKDATYTITDVPKTSYTGSTSILTIALFEEGQSYEFVNILTSGYIYSASDDSESSDTFGCDFTSITSAPFILDGFELKTGTQTITVDSFKDSRYAHINRYSDGDKFEVNDPYVFNMKVSTTQTITISE